MAKDIETDLDLNNIGRILNSPNPILLKEVANKDYVDLNKFSVKVIRNSKVLIIPEDHEMAIKKNMIIEGELIVLGELVII